MNWLKRFRKKKKMSQQSLAESLGVTQSYVSKIEQDQLEPNFLFLLDMRRRYKTNINKILDRLNEEIDMGAIDPWVEIKPVLQGHIKSVLKDEK